MNTRRNDDESQSNREPVLFAELASMSPPCSVIAPPRSPRNGLKREKCEKTSEELLLEGTVGEVVVECVGEAIRLLELREQMEVDVQVRQCDADALCERTVSEVVNEDEEPSPILGLLTPPTTDPESPASDTVIADEVLLESEDSKAVDESTCQSSTVSTANTTAIVCKWTHCDWPGSYDDLVDHIREIHVELQPYHNHQHIVASSSSSSSKTTRTAFAAIAAISSTDEPNATNGAVKSCKSSSFSSMSSRSAISSCSQQQYVCLWEGCKVYGKGSLSRSWLERHVLQHSGPRPFKCIVEGCGARFKARSALERHVNAHFNGSLMDNVSKDVPCVADDATNDVYNIHEGPMMMRCNGPTYHNCTVGAASGNASSSTTGTPNKLLKRKKVNKVKRRCVNLKMNEDYFDLSIMEHLKYSLYQLNAITGVDIVGSQRDITFHSRVIARRRENKTGSFDALLHYEPEDILPDIWVPESEMSEFSTRIVPITSLPCDGLAKLMEISEIRRPGRKQKRK